MKPFPEIEHLCQVGGIDGGMFMVPFPPSGKSLRVIASNGGGWDHVSVSLPSRCPTWAEMEHVKRTFFRDDEIALQIHLPPKDHINCHPFTLHLWRDQATPFSLPPKWMVGPS